MRAWTVLAIVMLLAGCSDELNGPGTRVELIGLPSPRGLILDWADRFPDTCPLHGTRLVEHVMEGGPLPVLVHLSLEGMEYYRLKDERFPCDRPAWHTVCGHGVNEADRVRIRECLDCIAAAQAFWNRIEQERGGRR